MAETSRTKNIKKLISCVGVMAGLLASEDPELQKRVDATLESWKQQQTQDTLDLADPEQRKKGASPAQGCGYSKTQGGD